MSENYSLVSYTRVPSSRTEANNEDIAYSMHLAIRSNITGVYEPLNDNYGIFFAAAVPNSKLPKVARKACTAGELLKSDKYSLGVDISDAYQYDAVMPDHDIILKSLKSPYIFRLADGSFGIIATRTARGGKPDGSERQCALIATSEDLISYKQIGLLYLDTTAGVHRPSVQYDEQTQQYTVSWYDDANKLWFALTKDIIGAVNSKPLSARQHVEGDISWHASMLLLAPTQVSGLTNVVIGSSIAISAEEALRLQVRFGRRYNTSVNVPEATLSASLSPVAAQHAVAWLAQTKVELNYSDGSHASRRVDWDKDELEVLSQNAQSGALHSGETVVLHGKVRCQQYPVPFAVERADPSIFAWNYNGVPKFLFIATEDEGGNCIDPRNGNTHMPLRIADSIYELSDEAGGREREIDLLVRGSRNSEGKIMTGCFWAPELHVINGHLSILFMPCFDGPEKNPDGSRNERAGKADMWTGRCHIMQLKKDSQGDDLDPANPGNWTIPEPIYGPNKTILNPVQRISLDMTVFEDSGRWYYAWQQVGSVWIATFDPEQPAQLTSQPTQIVVPEFAWDNSIAEGPNVVKHDGKLYMIYSGSLVGIDYTTGLVTATADSGVDLCDPSAWQKLDYPLQKSGIYNGQWQLGTGHGMWSHDEDGNMIYVFHNAEYENGQYGGRDAQVRRVHWASDGLPVLDMQKDEELDESFAQVALKIAVID